MFVRILVLVNERCDSPVQTPETSFSSFLSPSASASSSSRSGSDLASPTSYLTAFTSPMSSPSYSPLSPSASSPVFTFQSPPLASPLLPVSPGLAVSAKARTASFCGHAALRQLSSTCKRPRNAHYLACSMLWSDLNSTLCVCWFVRVRRQT